MDGILNIVIKGIIIGIVVSAPLGPVGVLCIQRTLNKGRWYGFVTGIGASISDIGYAALTAFGMSFVIDLIDHNMFYLQLFGSILLLLFGIFTYKTSREKEDEPKISATQPKGSYFKNLITAFFVTLSNPLIVFLFLTLFARFSFIHTDITVSEISIGFVAIASGALIWWFLLTYLVGTISTLFNSRGISMINKVIGAIVSVVGIIGVILTLNGSSLY